MTEHDIVARLRQTHWNGCNCVGCEAADEIERLRVRVAELEDRLSRGAAE